MVEWLLGMIVLMNQSNVFAYTREQFQQTVEEVLAIARRRGASDAGAEVSDRKSVV